MLILLGLVFTCVLVHAQDDQSGFISIDCGIDKGETYTDDITKINYVSGANFIDSGENHYTSHKSGTDTQLTTLTSFPHNTRNCYTLKPTQGKGNKYLIRARFIYGNYDKMDGKLPEFDVHLGPNYWDTVRIESPLGPKNMEIIHVLSSDYVHVCLVNTALGTPFISAIELRLLAGNMYVDPKYSGSLYLFRRLRFGSPKKVRYPADKYDRLWSPFVSATPTYFYNTSSPVTSNNYNVPMEVMQFYIYPILDYSFVYDWEPKHTTDRFILYMHFAELRIMEQDEKRESNIYINDKLYEEAYSPKTLTTETLPFLVELSPTYKLNISSTDSSSLTYRPSVNALEFYTIIVLPQNQTYDKDAAAMRSIKSTYGVAKNWQGDPCAPHEFVWDGIRCGYDDSKSLRIVMLNLSTSGLSGEIDSGLANLTMMQTLDLSNNNLTGTVPDFLSGFKYLTELNLKGNSFSRPIPSGLLAKAKTGSLSLSLDDESTGGIPASKKDNKIIIPLIIGVIIVAVIAIFIVLGVLWKIKKKKKLDRVATHAKTEGPILPPTSAATTPTAPATPATAPATPAAATEVKTSAKTSAAPASEVH